MMMNRQKLLLILLSVFVPCAAQAMTWWERSVWENPNRSELWYPPPANDSEEVQVEDAKVQTPPDPQSSASDQLQAVQEQLQELRAAAILDPSPANIKAYVAYQEAQLDRASVFADSWRRVLWANPELLYANRFRPTNALALGTFDAQYAQTLSTGIKKLSDTHGIYFFFSSTCPYCHVMAQTLKLVSERTGLQVFAISLDARGIPGFENPAPDKGQAAALGVKSVPTYFLVQPATQSVFPLGSGVMAVTDLEDRIYTQAYTRPGQKF